MILNKKLLITLKMMAMRYIYRILKFYKNLNLTKIHFLDK